MEQAETNKKLEELSEQIHSLKEKKIFHGLEISEEFRLRRLVKEYYGIDRPIKKASRTQEAFRDLSV